MCDRLTRGSHPKPAWLRPLSALVLLLSCLSSVAHTQDAEPRRKAAREAAIEEVPVETDAAAGDADEKVHPLVPALKLAGESRAALEKVRDYTAVFTKREVVGKRVIQQSMDLKLRHEPFSVYLRFRDMHKGREVIFVEGQNGGNLLVHEEGVKAIAGTVRLLPNSPEAMQENRHPVTNLGMQKLLDKIIAQWESETKYGETSVQYFPDAKIGAQPVQVIETTHPKPRRQFKYHITRLYLDKETNLPVRLEQLGWPAAAGEKPPVLEMYMYTNVKTNVGFSDRDFDTRNPAYRY